MVNVKCVFRGLRSRGRFSSSAGANKRKCGDSKGSQVSERCRPVNADPPLSTPARSMPTDTTETFDFTCFFLKRDGIPQKLAGLSTHPKR